MSEKAYEQERLQEVLQTIDEKIAARIEGAGMTKEEVIELRRTFWDDVTINLDEPDDVIETEASIRQQAELLSQQERFHQVLTKQLATYERMQNSPYFGKLNFVEDGEGAEEEIYIGLSSLQDRDDDNFLVYDWRAPISSMYYDYAPGKARYETDGEVVTGEMKRKRQFIIRQGELSGMFDTGLTIGDQLLQHLLSQASSNEMKSIVTTIQKEQNAIIRNQRARMLIVQGAAGSGKTSAAMQRVAYLLYTYRNTFNSGNMLLLSPNPLFNQYVSGVLPELGEENLKQTTFQHHISRRLPEGWTLESPYGQIERQLANEQLEEDLSLTDQDLPVRLDRYIARLKEDGMTFYSIMYRNQVWKSAEELAGRFYDFDETISIENRIEIMSGELVTGLQQLEKKQLHEDWVTDAMEDQPRELYALVSRKVMQKQDEKETYNSHVQEDRLVRKYVVRQTIKPLKAQIEKHEFVDVEQLYENFTNRLVNQHLRFEDAAPFFYLNDQVKGRPDTADIRFLFIDEAQDYTSMHIRYLENLFPRARFTLLGDVEQAVHQHTAEGQSILTLADDEDRHVERITLKQSYRSTARIMNFAKELLPKDPEMIPFQREGDLPVIRSFASNEAMQQAMLEKASAWQGEGKLAVLTKTMAEANILAHASHEYAQLITETTDRFKKQVLIAPSYLAKGIEFDEVIMYGVDDETYQTKNDLHLLYTGCTRAMHQLEWFVVGKPQRVLQSIDTDLYKWID
ncbi:hypothetical protein DH09_17160 [Bacillaceae bacterium JMAK1]|nr:hypothetical protein DH09_17160 [Bacillaceae bacterium JMAK1]